GQLLREVRRLGEALELIVAHHLDAHLQVQVGDHRNDVRVAGPLAPAVQARLHLRGSGAYGHQRARHGGVDVIVRMDTNLTGDSRTSRAYGLLDLPRQVAAVGVAQGDRGCAGALRGAQRGECVFGVLAESVEEVLRIQDHLAPLTHEVGDGV